MREEDVGQSAHARPHADDVDGQKGRHMEMGSPARAAFEGGAHVQRDLRGELLLGLAAEEEHPVLLARVGHVMELSGGPWRLEVGDGGEADDVEGG